MDAEGYSEIARTGAAPVYPIDLTEKDLAILCCGVVWRDFIADGRRRRPKEARVLNQRFDERSERFAEAILTSAREEFLERLPRLDPDEVVQKVLDITGCVNRKRDGIFWRLGAPEHVVRDCRRALGTNRRRQVERWLASRPAYPKLPEIVCSPYRHDPPAPFPEAERVFAELGVIARLEATVRVLEFCLVRSCLEVCNQDGLDAAQAQPRPTNARLFALASLLTYTPEELKVRDYPHRNPEHFDGKKPYWTVGMVIAHEAKLILPHIKNVIEERRARILA